MAFKPLRAVNAFIELCRWVHLRVLHVRDRGEPFTTCEKWSQAITQSLRAHRLLKRQKIQPCLLLTPSFKTLCVSLLIKPRKNAENADTISRSVRVSMLLYPHIIRAELTMASYWRNERSHNGWHWAESNRKRAASHLLKLLLSEVSHEMPVNCLPSVKETNETQRWWPCINH